MYKKLHYETGKLNKALHNHVIPALKQPNHIKLLLSMQYIKKENSS